MHHAGDDGPGAREKALPKANEPREPESGYQHWTLIVTTAAGRVAPDDALLAPMRRYYADNGRHILFDDLREIFGFKGGV